MNLQPRLTRIVGDRGVSTEPGDLEAYGRDWTRFTTPAPSAIVFPRTIPQLQELVLLARDAKIGLVPSGGRTGLSGGACATRGEIVVSFDRMNRILDFNEAEGTVTVEAGVVTRSIQEYAKAKQRYYPVDFASSGSSQIGGNIATNAGGIRVIRYGMTRDQVTGLRVVTGRGEVLSLNRGLTKNNTGYDLRHLFVGSEGTLGFIAEATLRLTMPPAPTRVVLLAVNRMQDCIAILEEFRGQVTLAAFEFFSQAALVHVMASGALEAPFGEPSPFYVLLEVEVVSDADLDRALAAFERGMESGLVSDGIIAGSDSQNAALWAYRERISEAITPRTPYKNDVSVKVGQVPAFLEAVEAEVAAAYPEFEIVWFGHIGDGNLHLNILRPHNWETDRFRSECERVGEQLLRIVEAFGGSVSAEHGIGLLKRGQLVYSRDPEEIESMRAIKAVFDPDGIMNPGKLLPDP